MSDIYLQITETPTVVTLSAPVVSGALASTVTVANTVTVALDSNSLSALENVTVTVGAAITGTVTVSNFPATQPVSIASVTIGNTVTIAGTVTANPTGTQTIAGTVTANVGNISSIIGGGFSDLFSIIDDASFRVEVNSLPTLPAGTNRIGVVTIGAGTVTVGNISSLPDANSNPVVRTFVFGYDYQNEEPVAIANNGTSLSVAGSVTIGSALPAGSNQIGSVTASISNSVTIASLPAISGTVTANLSISSTAITSGSFTSLTSATLVPANTSRKMATVYNLGAGQLFVNAGATATTLGGGFMVALSSGDFYECDYTTTTLSAIFATAGTASWVSH